MTKKVLIQPKYNMDLIDPKISIQKVIDDAKLSYIKDAIMYHATVFEVIDGKHYMLDARNYNLPSEEIKKSCKGFTEKEVQEIIKNEFSNKKKIEVTNNELVVEEKEEASVPTMASSKSYNVTKEEVSTPEVVEVENESDDSSEDELEEI